MNTANMINTDLTTSKRRSLRALATLCLTLLLLAPGLLGARTLQIEVNGLVCAFCAKGITKAVGKLKATEEVLVSLEHRLVAVALRDGQDIDDVTITRLLTDAGYTVVAIQRVDTSLEDLRAGLGKP